MADKKVTALNAITGADTADGDLYTVVDVSANENKKQTAAEARIAIMGASTPAAMLATLGVPQTKIITFDATALATLKIATSLTILAPSSGSIALSPTTGSFYSSNVDGSNLAGGSSWKIRWSARLGDAIFAPDTNLFGIIDEIEPIIKPLLRADSSQLLSDIAGASIVIVTNSDDPVITGAIAASNIVNGGSGWVPGNTFTYPTVASNGTDAVGVVDTAPGGAMETYHFTNAGTGIIPAGEDAITATSGVGIDATIEVTAIDVSVNPVTLTVILDYRPVETA